MIKKFAKILNFGAVFLTASNMLFSSPVYAETVLDKNISKKNIEHLIEKDCNADSKDKPKHALSLSEYYFFSRAKKLDDGPYSEISYEREINDKLSFQLAAGYMELNAIDVNYIRKEKLTVIPIHAGLKKKLFGPLHLKLGPSYYFYHLDSVEIPSEFGGYIGFEISSGKNPSLFLELRRQFGDLDINYALLEDETNIMGNLIGFGAKFKW